MMSPLANYRAFLSSFRHIPPQESFVKRINYSDKNIAAREIWRLGQNILEMDVRTFARIKIACTRLSGVGDGAKRESERKNEGGLRQGREGESLKDLL